MSGMKTFLLPSALVRCWHLPLTAGGAAIARVWPEEQAPPVASAGGWTALDRPEGMGLYQVALGGVKTKILIQ
jgi:hypothetical protein